jgi:hypothetical protein
MSLERRARLAPPTDREPRRESSLKFSSGGDKSSEWESPISECLSFLERVGGSGDSKGREVMVEAKTGVEVVGTGALASILAAPASDVLVAKETAALDFGNSSSFGAAGSSGRMAGLLRGVTSPAAGIVVAVLELGLWADTNARNRQAGGLLPFAISAVMAAAAALTPPKRVDALDCRVLERDRPLPGSVGETETAASLAASAVGLLVVPDGNAWTEVGDDGAEMGEAGAANATPLRKPLFLSLSSTLRTADGLTNSPCIGGHSKYRRPWTLPSFLPAGSSNSRPSHSPAAKSATPMNRMKPWSWVAPTTTCSPRMKLYVTAVEALASDCRVDGDAGTGFAVIDITEKIARCKAKQKQVKTLGLYKFDNQSSHLSWD